MFYFYHLAVEVIIGWVMHSLPIVWLLWATGNNFFPKDCIINESVCVYMPVLFDHEYMWIL